MIQPGLKSGSFKRRLSTCGDIGTEAKAVFMSAKADNQLQKTRISNPGSVLNASFLCCLMGMKMWLDRRVGASPTPYTDLFLTPRIPGLPVQKRVFCGVRAVKPAVSTPGFNHCRVVQPIKKPRASRGAFVIGFSARWSRLRPGRMRAGRGRRRWFRRLRTCPALRWCGGGSTGRTAPRLRGSPGSAR